MATVTENDNFSNAARSPSFGGTSRRPRLPGKAFPPSPRDVDFSFRCRAVIRDNANSPREMHVVVEYVQGFSPGLGGTSVTVRSLRARKNGDGWVASKSPTVFCAMQCTHVTPRDEVASRNILVAHFDKIAALKEERTKVSILKLRGWHGSDIPAIERLADVLSDAVAVNIAKKEKDKAPLPKSPYDAARKPHRLLPSSSRRARAPSSVSTELRNMERQRQPRLTTADRLRVASKPEIKPAYVKPVRGLSAASGWNDANRPVLASGTDNSVQPGTGRKNKFAMMSAVTQGLIGRPPDADQPLRQTKGERMRTRERQAQVAVSSHVPASTPKKRPVPVSPRSALLERQTAFKNRDVLPPAAKRQRSGYGDVESQVAPATRVSDRTNSQRGVRNIASLSQSPCTGVNVRVTRSRASPAGSDGEGGGILNLGNTCYLGSALQALLCDPTFVEDIVAGLRLGAKSGGLLASNEGTGQGETPFANAVMEMVGSRKNGGAPFNPQLVRAALSAHFGEFGTAAQQDVHEFITRCFCVLERELGQTGAKRCPVARNFSIVVESTHSCTQCGYHFEPRKELFRDLSIDIPEQQSVDLPMNAAVKAARANQAVADALDVIDVHAEEVLSESAHQTISKGAKDIPAVGDLLHDYFATQVVDLNCESPSCDGKKAEKKSAVALAPRILVLHLKRFRVESNRSGRYSLVKVNDLVQIPEFVDLKDFLVSGALSPAVFDRPVSLKKLDVGSNLGPTPSSGSRPRKDQLRAVPGRCRVNPPSPEADKGAVKDKLFDVDVDLGKYVQVEGTKEALSPGEEMCLNSPLGTCGEFITQVPSPEESQSPVIVRSEKRAMQDCDSAQVESRGSCLKNIGPGTRAPTVPRRTFAVFGQENVANSGVRKSDVRTRGFEVPVGLGEDKAEDVDAEGFEPTQAPMARSLECETERSLIFKLAEQFNVSHAKAQYALRCTNFDYTRASGILLDAPGATQAATQSASPAERETAVGCVFGDRGRVEKYALDVPCENGPEMESVLELLERSWGAKSSEPTRTKYELAAIVRHHSPVAEYGHYVCDILQPDGSWTVYNDSDVRPSGARPFESEDRMREGYMFFYRLA